MELYVLEAATPIKCLVLMLNNGVALVIILINKELMGMDCLKKKRVF